MPNLEKNLRDIAGFTEKEIKVYLALLGLGQGSVIDIAQKSGLKRTTVYNLIPGLAERGFIQTTKRKGRRMFFIDDTRSLSQKLEERKERLAMIMPELEAMHNILPLKPKVKFYEGFEGMKEVYLDMLKTCQPGDEILEFGGFRNVYEMLTPEFVKYYISERVKKKIRIRLIAPKGPEAVQLQKESAGILREVKLFDEKQYQFQSYLGIYKNKIALISYAENFMAVIIESKQLSDMQRVAFEIIWQSLSS